MGFYVDIRLKYISLYVSLKYRFTALQVLEVYVFLITESIANSGFEKSFLVGGALSDCAAGGRIAMLSNHFLAAAGRVNTPFQAGKKSIKKIKTCHLTIRTLLIKYLD